MNPELACKHAKRLIRVAEKRNLTDAQVAELQACLGRLSQSKRAHLEGFLKRVQNLKGPTTKQSTEDNEEINVLRPLSKFSIGRGESKSPAAVRETILRCVSFRHLARNKTAFELYNEFSCKGVLLLKLELTGDTKPDMFSTLNTQYPFSISLSTGTQISNTYYFETILEEDMCLKMQRLTDIKDLLLESEQFTPFLYLPPQCVINSLANNWNGVLLAIDCEMIHTTVCENDLARVTIVECNTKATTPVTSIFSLIYDAYVELPNNIKVIDYKTQYSGITAQILENASSKYPKNIIRDHILSFILPSELHKLLYAEQIQHSTDLSALNGVSLPFIIGHGVENDLRALGLIYPLIIDTCVLYQYGTRKPRLQDLARRYLLKDIQTNAETGHSSIEDAEAALHLVLLRLELSNIHISSILSHSLSSSLAGKAVQKYFNILRERQMATSKESMISLSQSIYKYQVMKSEAISQYAYGVLSLYNFKSVQHFTLSGAKSPPTLGELLLWISTLPPQNRKLCIAIPAPIASAELLPYLQDIQAYIPPQILVLCIVHAGDITMCPFVSGANSEQVSSENLLVNKID
ncbi:Exonuclease [Giardia lamblia P15]|uniref:Exonuclease n=1 Tax=Giardia intestinalis (strain P15) TaxID=658858 RepID=E1F1G8_GIAIA|nr:Exonuclease [Giardia lamblia P15]